MRTFRPDANAAKFATALRLRQWPPFAGAAQLPRSGRSAPAFPTPVIRRRKCWRIPLSTFATARSEMTNSDFAVVGTGIVD